MICLKLGHQLYLLFNCVQKMSSDLFENVIYKMCLEILIVTGIKMIWY